MEKDSTVSPIHANSPTWPSQFKVTGAWSSSYWPLGGAPDPLRPAWNSSKEQHGQSEETAETPTTLVGLFLLIVAPQYSLLTLPLPYTQTPYPIYGALPPLLPKHEHRPSSRQTRCLPILPQGLQVSSVRGNAGVSVGTTEKAFSLLPGWLIARAAFLGLPTAFLSLGDSEDAAQGDKQRRESGKQITETPAEHRVSTWLEGSAAIL